MDDRDDSKELLDQLRSVLHNLSDHQLSLIGVSLERQNDDWLWLRDAFAEALFADGRDRAARSLQDHGLENGSYSMAISKSFLLRLLPILRSRIIEQHEKVANG